MEPTIYVEKYTSTSGEAFYDRERSTQAPGDWRAFMVTFPLREPVREIEAATVAYPTEMSPYNDLMTPQEQEVRDKEKDKAN
jgi:hypothetical protein